MLDTIGERDLLSDVMATETSIYWVPTVQIKLISNPNSGHNRKNPKHIEKLSQILGDKVNLPRLEELDSTIEQYKKDKLDILAVSGGDGTIHQVLSAVHRVYKNDPWPKIALLTSGTMNNIARNVGVRKKAEPQLRSIMDTLRNNSPIQTNVHHPLLFGEDKAGFIFGQGGIPHVLEEYEKGGNTSRKKGAILLTRTILSALVNGSFVRKMFKPMNIDVFVDGQKQKHTRYTVSVLSSISDVGFGFRPCYAPLKNPKIAQFVGFTRHPFFTAFCLPKIRLALPINSKSVQDSQGKEFILRPQNEMLYTIDGDLYTCVHNLNIRVGPAVEFII